MKIMYYEYEWVYGIKYFIILSNRSKYMPQGLQVFYGDGKLILDAKTRTTKLMNQVSLTTKSGRIKISDFNGDRMWYFIYPPNGYDNFLDEFFTLSVTRDGWLSWDYGATFDPKHAFYRYYKFYYGEY